MDYILFGMGFGASLMLIGWALRTFGPGWKYASVISDDAPDMYLRKRLWNRFIQGLGGVLAIAGTSTVLLTFLVMLSNPDDDTGTMFSLVIWLFISLIVLGWCLTYLSHYGCTGIWSRDEGYGFGSASLRSGSAGKSTHGRQRPNAVATIPSDSDISHVVNDEDTGTMNTALEEPLTMDSVVETEAEIDPAYDFGDAEDATVPAAPEDHSTD